MIRHYQRGARLASSTTLLILAVACATLGCHKSEAASANDGAKPGPNEVWLTQQQIADAKVQTAPLDEQDVDDTIVTSGKVQGEDVRTSHVFSPVTGRVTRVDAELGMPVKKGDSLALIESPDIGSAISDVAKANADLIAAQHDYLREKDLYEKHAVSQKDLEQAEDTYRKSQAEMERAQMKATLLRPNGAKLDTQGFTLRAGVDGDVIARNIGLNLEVQGQYSGGNAQELFTVADLSEVWVFADIFEMDLARVKKDAKVIVTVVSYPDKKFEGKVDYVAGTLDVNTHTARVRCTLSNPDKYLKPEMYATIAISVDQRKSLAIFHDSLVRLGDSTVVFVDGGPAPDNKTKFIRRPVIVDEGEGGPWLPLQHSELNKGDKVVTAGAVLISGMM